MDNHYLIILDKSYIDGPISPSKKTIFKGYQFTKSMMEVRPREDLCILLGGKPDRFEILDLTHSAKINSKEFRKGW
jgi:hypothetical protein